MPRWRQKATSSARPGCWTCRALPPRLAWSWKPCRTAKAIAVCRSQPGLGEVVGRARIPLAHAVAGGVRLLCHTAGRPGPRGSFGIFAGPAAAEARRQAEVMVGPPEPLDRRHGDGRVEDPVRVCSAQATAWAIAVRVVPGSGSPRSSGGR